MTPSNEPDSGGGAAHPLPPRPRRSKQLAVLACTLLALTILIEAALQLGAWVVWLKYRHSAPRIAAGHHVILCVGDSWTHGMGSSDPIKRSYPGVLQTLLRERTTQEWTVVNGGLSGQNSRDVLERLPSQLAEFRPNLLCVLVGQNDFWSLPAELRTQPGSEAIDHSAYRFRWRLPRLVDWAYGRLRGSGRIHSNLTRSRGPEWAPRTVAVQLPYANEPRKWKLDPAAAPHQQAGWRLGAQKDIPGALAEFERAFAIDPSDPRTRQGLLQLYMKSNRGGEAAAHLQWLINSWNQDQDYWTGSSLVAAFDGCLRSQEALDLAVKFLERFPKDAMVWRYRAQAEFALGRHHDAKRSVEESIRLAPDRWAYFLRFKVCLLGLRDVDEAIRTVYQAYGVFNDADTAVQDMRALATTAGVSRLRPVLDAFDSQPDVRKRLAQLVEDVATAMNTSAPSVILSKHLRRIATAARAAGAVPVFLTYPIGNHAETEMRAVSKELDVKFVPVKEVFEQRLGGRRVADVRAPDGHCNDAGYQLMAEVIADGLQDLIRPQGR